MPKGVPLKSVEERKESRRKSVQKYKNNKKQQKIIDPPIVTEKMVIYQRHTKRLRDAKIMLGGKCEHCYEDDFDVLDFDHLVPEQKKYTVACMSNYSDIVFQEEVFKCRLLCANCHRRHTKKQRADGIIKTYRGLTKESRMLAC